MITMCKLYIFKQIISNFQPDTTTDGNANIRRQSHNEGLHKSLPSFNSIKRNSLTSNYTNNNTPASPHEKLRHSILLPLEGFPDPPYDKEIFQREKQPTFKRLCRSFQDILDSSDTFDCSVLSRASTPSLSSNKEYTSLVQYFQQVSMDIYTVVYVVEKYCLYCLSFTPIIYSIFQHSFSF